MNLQIIDALWNKMLVTYGSEWTRKFGDQPLDEVKGAWADDLRGFRQTEDPGAMAEPYVHTSRSDLA